MSKSVEQCTIFADIDMMISKNISTLIIVFIGLITLASCSPYKHTYKKPGDIGAFSRNDAIKDQIYRQYHNWKGTPYRAGGMSKRGVDCSGFVLLTFRSQFGMDIPRTTKAQMAIGSYISKKSLQAGDLVFFKTGWWKRHVGIYIEHNKFLHASTRYGVIISTLDDDYWQNTYLQAKRVDFQ